jgi:YD repeat-containing protein
MANAGRTSFTYDAAGQLLAQFDLKSDDSVISSVDYQYDNTGNRTRMREATGRLTTWTYDDTYQLVSEHRSSASGGFHITYTYDPVGNRLVKNSSASLTTSTFDAADQLQTSVDSTGTTTFTFDAAGNQQIEQAPSGTTTRTWDYENQQTGVVLPSGSRVTMSYNADFRRVRKES